MKTWYKNWFDSPFYHILYKDRDQEEANAFLDHLFGFLKPDSGSRILAQACGKGRHARYLNSLGYQLTGIDLSPASISYCKRYENEKLQFYVQDMRKVFRINYYDIVLNLFTSFGYFETDHQQELVVQAATKSLNRGGYYVIDFMNAEKVLAGLQPETSITKEGIGFHITKRYEGNFLIKTIQFKHDGNSYEFQERVEMMYPEDFERYFKNAGLKTLHLFGNYELEPFNRKFSDRLILVAGKP